MSVAASDLIAYARHHLPLYKIPRRFALPLRWPLTSSGKNDFEALHRMWEREPCGVLS
jgi:long-chain acyl-CoA synthetase